MSHEIQLSSITIVPSHSSAAKIELSCFPSTFDPIRPGIHIQVHHSMADQSKPALLATGHSTGPVLLHSFETIETAWTENHPNETSLLRTHWLAPSYQPGFFTIVMRELRSAAGQPRIEQLLVSFPSALQPGTEFTSESLYFHGPIHSVERLSHRVDGLFVFTCNLCQFEAVRLTSWRPERREIKTEIFIDVSNGLARFARKLARNDVSKITSKIPVSDGATHDSNDWYYDSFSTIQWSEGESPHP